MKNNLGALKIGQTTIIGKAKPAAIDLEEIAYSNHGFVPEFLTLAKKAPFVFVHKYPDADAALKGMDLIARAPIVENYKDEILILSMKGATSLGGMKEGEHVFLSVPRWKKLAKGLVEKIADGKAYVVGMGSEAIE
jgi:hypothetical protein